MDNLDPEMFEFVLSEIRRHFKEFYHAPKPKEYPDWDAESRGAYGGSLRDAMIREMRYMRGGPIGMSPPLRGEEARKAWEMVEIDYASMEGYISRAFADKADIFKKIYGGEPGILYEESHHLKAEDLWIKKEPRDEQPRIGAGKNPFAEHTIRSMKGKRR